MWPFRVIVRLLMFEFSRFYPTDYQHGREFVADLDKFLAALPQGWPYGITASLRGVSAGLYSVAISNDGRCLAADCGLPVSDITASGASYHTDSITIGYPRAKP
jgi:hypothetical protein